MRDETFIVIVFALFLLLIRWAFKALPKEGWQIMASVPVSRKETGEWQGMNLTYYGVFVASACVLAVAVFICLMGAIGFPVEGSIAAVLAILGLCLPASSLLARVVEKKRHTLTVGGASFLGILAAPWILWGIAAATLSQDGGYAIMLPAMAAMSIAYAFGEGIGRLACISFGCCYGKPLADCPSWVRKLVGGHSFVFAGCTKKISYESGLNGRKVIPVQGITSVLYVCVGLVSMLLYLKGHYGMALSVSMIVTQAWRAYSETLRADYRGNGTVSAYQVMAVAAVGYALLLLIALPAATTGKGDLFVGLHALWDPTVLLFLQILGLAVFLFSGRSTVTGSNLTFYVITDRI